MGLPRIEAQRVHARLRLAERFGRHMSPIRYRAFTERVLRGRPRVVARQKNRRVIEIPIRPSSSAYAVIDEFTGEICTYLTADQFARNFPLEAESLREAHSSI